MEQITLAPDPYDIKAVMSTAADRILQSYDYSTSDDPNSDPSVCPNPFTIYPEDTTQLRRLEADGKIPVVRTVGCGRVSGKLYPVCDACLNTSLQCKRHKWCERLRYECQFGKEWDYIVWSVLTQDAQRYEDLEVFKERVSDLVRILRQRLKRNGLVVDLKYVVFYEGKFNEGNRHGNRGDNTRLHANVIWFVDTTFENQTAIYRLLFGPDPAEIGNTVGIIDTLGWIKDYWRERYAYAPEGVKHYRVNHENVAYYITKYVVKEGLISRTQGSQFGWLKKMERWRADKLQVDLEVGYITWHAVDLTALQMMNTRLKLASKRQRRDLILLSDAEIDALLPIPEVVETIQCYSGDGLRGVETPFKSTGVIGDPDLLDAVFNSDCLMFVPGGFDWNVADPLGGVAKWWQDVKRQVKYERNKVLEAVPVSADLQPLPNPYRMHDGTVPLPHKDPILFKLFEAYEVPNAQA